MSGTVRGGNNLVLKLVQKFIFRLVPLCVKWSKSFAEHERTNNLRPAGSSSQCGYYYPLIWFCASWEIFLHHLVSFWAGSVWIIHHLETQSFTFQLRAEKNREKYIIWCSFFIRNSFSFSPTQAVDMFSYRKNKVHPSSSSSFWGFMNQNIIKILKWVKYNNTSHCAVIY